MFASKCMVVAFTVGALLLTGLTWLIYDAPALAWRTIQRNGSTGGSRGGAEAAAKTMTPGARAKRSWPRRRRQQ